MWVGNVNIRFKKLFEKKLQKTVYFVIYRVLSCTTRKLSFLLFKSTCIGTIFEKNMHVGVCMRRILKYFLLKLTKLLYGIKPKSMVVYSLIIIATWREAV